jgi:hypothetical protein
MWTPPKISTLDPIATAATLHRISAAPPPQIDVLMLSGFLISLLTLVVWMHPVCTRSRTLAFAACLLGLAIFGFLQGAWPLGVVAIVWSAATLQRWRQEKDIFTGVNEARRRIVFSQVHWESGSAKSRKFEWN